jgi:3-phenylpropionate/trans-cinnamate dioxygenase ferredoxin reductase subunit
MTVFSVTVVGGSLAGLATAEGLRRQGYDGQIRVVGEEPWLPYDRPPLSKEVLKNGLTADPPYLRTEQAIADLQVEWMLGRGCTSLDTGARNLLLTNGDVLPFDALVVATGARPRRLPQLDGVAGVHVLRSWDDDVALAAELAHASTVVVVGGGFIGCEVAASLRHRGIDVTIVEPFPTLLFGPFGAEVGGRLNRMHQDHGVRLMLGASVTGYRGAGRVEAVVLEDGRELPADLVVLGLGAVPNTEWLRGSGVACDDGVLCGPDGRTEIQDVYAVGDVARPESSLYGKRVRVEHWTSASMQGATVAATILGSTAGGELVRVPYFWSDQYDTRLNYVGLHERTDRVHVHGSDDEAWQAAWERDGVITAAVASGEPRLLPAMRSALGQPLETHWPIERSRVARVS